MGDILKYDDHIEFFARFIQVSGKRGTILLFSGGRSALDDRLAKDLEVVLDGETFDEWDYRNAHVPDE